MPSSPCRRRWRHRRTSYPHSLPIPRFTSATGEGEPKPGAGNPEHVLDCAPGHGATSADQRSPMALSSPVLTIDAQSLRAGGEVTLRRWIFRLGLLTAVLSAAALIVGLATLSGISQGMIFWPASMLLAGMALLAGVSSVVANRVHDILARRVDVLAHALEASPNAHLILGPRGTVAYANAAFRSLFPDGETAPLQAIQSRIAGDGDSAEEFSRLSDE